MEVKESMFTRIVDCCFIFSINLFYILQGESLSEAIKKTNIFVLVNGDFFNDYGIFILELLGILFLISLLIKSFLSILFAKLAESIDFIVSIIIDRLKTFLSVLSSVFIVNLLYLLAALIGMIQFDINQKQMNIYFISFMLIVYFFEYANNFLMKYRPVTRLDAYNIRNLRFRKY